MKTCMDYLWMNRETGELMTYEEAYIEGAELYDLDDPTNGLAFTDYYKRTDMEVPADWNEQVEDDGEPADIDDDCGFDPYEGCYTWDC